MGSFLGIEGNVNKSGFLISRVTEGRAAARAGLKKGDFIWKVGERRQFREFQDFHEKVISLKPGIPVALSARRNGLELEFQLVPENLSFKDFSTIIRHIENSRFLREKEGASDVIEEIRTLISNQLPAITNWSPVYELFNEAIGLLDVSHAALIPPWTYKNLFDSEALESGAYRLGFILEKQEVEAARRNPSSEKFGKENSLPGCFYYVNQILNDSPVDKAGIQLGDEVVRVNGVSVGISPRKVLAGYESNYPYFLLKVDPDEEITLDVRKDADGVIQMIKIKADQRISSLQASVKSLRVIEKSNYKIAYIHLWDFLSSKMPSILQDKLAIMNAKKTRGLIVDLRGRGGKIDVLKKILKILKNYKSYMVILIDKDTRSAKEVLTYYLKDDPGVTVVGQRTAGSVLPASYLSLSRGAALMLPSSPSFLTEHFGNYKSLEGTGVLPDILVNVELPYSRGADPILVKGIEVILEMMSSGEKRGPLKKKI